MAHPETSGLRLLVFALVCANVLQAGSTQPAARERFRVAIQIERLAANFTAWTDAIEGCFDDEAQGMMECPPEPNVILPLDATDPAAVRATFDTLGTICEVLAGASRLMDLMPGNDLHGG